MPIPTRPSTRFGAIPFSPPLNRKTRHESSLWRLAVNGRTLNSNASNRSMTVTLISPKARCLPSHCTYVTQRKGERGTHKEENVASARMFQTFTERCPTLSVYVVCALCRPFLGMDSAPLTIEIPPPNALNLRVL